MPVSLTLKRKGAYTNLDYVEGDVNFDISSSETIESIVVKVEGISKTTIYARKPGNDRGKPKPIVEVHKVLYLQQVVWPDQKLQESRGKSSGGHFTLQAGAYTFPFRLRIPINNACQPPPSNPMSMQNFHVTHNSITTVSTPLGHVKQTLPPSLGGIEDAWIRYFVKVTVNKPSFFSRNLRQTVPFVFCPIEPPRPPLQSQIFVRKKHILASAPRQDSFFSGLFRAKPPATGNGGTIVFEARLPNPAIIVPTEPIPLTFIINRDGSHGGVVYIRSVQVMLGITTFIAAQGFRRELGYLLPIMQLGDLNVTLPENKSEMSFKPGELLQTGHASKGLIVPDTVPPSFRTCNIARKYQLVLQLGVSSHPAQPPEMIQLTCDVQIFSGFKPPPEILSTAHPPPPPPAQSAPGPSGKVAEAGLGGELPTYDEAVADGLASPAVGTETQEDAAGRGHFEVDTQYLQGAEHWDDEKH